ncbi:MAG: methyltransferase domain-containing protein, partial [Magnetococcales bacterium]|nr:methyltransferase domain-containing protein [Magnetococcales bacterium]
MTTQTEPLAAELLELLQCPLCHETLRHPQNNALLCQGCGHWFPVRRGIPILLPEVASRETMASDDQSLPPGLQSRYWDTPSQAALYDRKVEGEADDLGIYTHLSEHYAMTTLYRPANLDRILDAGCGNGRFLADFPPQALTVGADASFHLLAIARARGRGRYHVCCALESLPFRGQSFSTVLSCRVLQHLQAQQQAVQEMARVTRKGGDVLIQVYNVWNLKTFYKLLRQSPLQPLLNAPFRLLFRSMSPFAPWELDYDRYTRWSTLANWMEEASLIPGAGRGAGFGFHKYFLVPFYLDALWKNRAPQGRATYYRHALAVEKRLAALFPFRYLLEKFTLRGEKWETPPPVTLWQKVKKNLAHGLHNLAACDARREAQREQSSPHRHDDARHLQAAVDWLCRAQDVTGCGGVSRGYGMIWNPSLQCEGWQPAYPETTGYLIPTFFDAACTLQNADLARRALAMARWEITVQLPNGAVQAGVIGSGRHPAVFNTGQVIPGWLRAFQESGQQVFLDAALQAGAFLLRHQDEDGGWSRHNSPFADARYTTYNSRVGLALIQLGLACGQEHFVAAGRRNIQFTLQRQQDNGWFADNCLSDPSAPLTHTLCYATEGILGAALLLGEHSWLQRAQITIDALQHAVSSQGRLAGRFDQHWQPKVSWDCLTGSAQLANLLLSLPHPTLEQRTTARNLLDFLCASQNLTSDNHGLRGGIKGSYPFGG